MIYRNHLQGFTGHQQNLYKNVHELLNTLKFMHKIFVDIILSKNILCLNFNVFNNIFVWALFIFINSLKISQSYENLCAKNIILKLGHFFWF